MKRIFTLAVIVALAGLGSPVLAGDVYGDSFYDYTPTDLYNPTNALGAPDGLYADFVDSGTYLVFDMGEGEEGTDDLTLDLYLFDIGAQITVTFYDDAMDVLHSYGDILSVGGAWTITYDESTPYRYVRVQAGNNKNWSLDAITAAAVVEEEVTEEPVDEEPVDEEPTPEEETGPVAGDLIKSEEFSAVYLLGSDGKRHAFPNETVFFSWNYSFDDVVTISSEALAGYTLGRNVTIKPDTYLVKLQTNPKTYAVAPDATLRWVTSESVAISLYGSDWAENVVDVADVFWPNYTVGEDIDEQADIEGWEIPEHAF